jgi:hypothetical protein
MLSDDKSIITYNRYLSQSKQRGAALKYLRSLGIKTLEIKQVNTFFRGDGPIVVYTDPQGHNGSGKRIMTVDDAVRTYGNCIASKYWNTDGMTIKYLQIGKRRFSLYFKKETTQSLEIGTLIDIRENSPEYNRLVGLPIFSIDYISDGQYMIATDFNEVENLSMIGMNRYLDSNTVINEIVDSLLIYNKI